MPQRLDINYEHKVLLKVFKSSNVRGFAEITIPEEGRLSVEIQRDPSYTAIKTRLKKTNGSILTRTLKLNFALQPTEQDFKMAWNPNEPTPGSSNVIESIYDTERQLLIDFRNMGSSGTHKNLRIGNLKTLRAAFFPVIGNEEARNFLEIFRGEYPPSSQRYMENEMMAFPETIFYGPNYFDIPTESVGSRRSQVAHYLGYGLRERRGSIASIRDDNGERIGLFHNWREGEVTFFGITKETGSISITSEVTENNVPDINLSIFPSLTSIITHFDIHEELEILNSTKRDKTIVKWLCSEDITNLISKVYMASLGRL